MKNLYLATAKLFCATTMALAASACGGDEGHDSEPELDIERSGVEAPLQEGDGSAGCPLLDGPHSFNELKGSLENLPVDCVPSWTEEQLSTGFASIRDTRVPELIVAEQPGFLRRIPWLEPESGCEERAPAATYFLHQWGYPTPWYARVQSRGNTGLTLVTENEPDGEVSWSHHVAPVVRVGGQLMILDPAIEPTGPLPIAAWLSRFVASEVDMAVCRDRADESGCIDAVPATPALPNRIHSQGLRGKLISEWRVQELLGRDPYRSLGDCPPWAACPPEPAADPDLPPTIARFASDRTDMPAWYPIYVIGDNFVEGLTTVRITGPGVDELAPISAINKRRILIETLYPAGDYQVTASNGAHASQTVSLTIE
ncbi:protein-glutamine glutaminase family protein [Sorangium sp. So ce119]|uniref:protein-glutamine glutaminase family protein n=1 Tax=Sorangium sp. So ce119 TaxID=3133279 RepID=UPI003F60389D